MMSVQSQAMRFLTRCARFACLLILLALSGCATQSQKVASFVPVSSPPPSQDGSPATSAVQTEEGPSLFYVEGEDSSDQERLTRLWQKRTQEQKITDYPIGPGDVLELNVSTVEELTNRTVRVSGDGTIALPFVGELRVAGLTEKELRTELQSRLEKYMYTPQIHLLVKEYRSRQVAVVGAVEKPGLYNLASSSDTILDILSLAGGMKTEAAPRINLIPAESTDTTNTADTQPIQPTQTQLTGSVLPMVMKTGSPITIDLRNLTKGGNQKYLSLPARPGDVIMVSASGEVLVAGWVEKPASYKITPGLTVLGAIQAAGGSHFAANMNTVKVIRSGRDGEKLLFHADLEKISRGESKDAPVQDGDVIEVSSSAVKLVPYSFYHFISRVFNAGVYMR